MDPFTSAIFIHAITAAVVIYLLIRFFLLKKKFEEFQVYTSTYISRLVDGHNKLAQQNALQQAASILPGIVGQGTARKVSDTPPQDDDFNVDDIFPQS